MGRDTGATNLSEYIAGFNPRARVGRDKRRWLAFDDCMGFNPRARVGRDAFAQPISHKEVEFQSTRPRGARLARLVLDRSSSLVSIHAPAWGATVALYKPYASEGFQSTRPRGARPRNLDIIANGNQRFNPRARVGRDRVASVCSRVF